MLIVVSYDIPDDRRRTKLADAIKNYGQRVQYSVFECRLDAAQVERLSASVLRIIDSQEDAVRIYRLCAGCAGGVLIHGLGKVTEDPEVYVL